MQRILILGCCGAGKWHYWQPNWTPTPKAAWKATVTKLASRPQWIMDGNYAGTLDLRLPRADTVFYLDYPTAVCLWRITKRIVRYHGRVRPGMPVGCRERFDWPFYHYVATFNLRRRKALLRKLAGYRNGTRVHVLSGDRACADIQKASTP